MSAKTNPRDKGVADPSHSTIDVKYNSHKGRLPLFVRAATFEICRMLNCPLSNTLEPHLLITIKAVALKRGNAVALSYARGDFNRLPVCVGHFRDGRSVELELGEEWATADLVRALAGLCVADGDGPSGACWIDQLCISQTEEEIRFALSRIPEIFQILDVVALLPGSLCRCLEHSLDGLVEDSVKNVEVGDEFAHTTNQVLKEARGRVSKCLNAYGCSSYFKRIWTRQEFLYATRVRLLWISGVEAECVNRPAADGTLTQAEIANLNPYLRLVYTRGLQVFDGDAVKSLALLRKTIIESDTSVLDSHTAPWPYPDTHVGWQYSQHRRMMLGHWMKRRQPRYSESEYGDLAQVLEFLDDLKLLAGSNREATHLKDYVLAVWVDCPRYQIPTAYKSLSIVELLEDAISQLEINFGLTIPTTASYGLFNKPAEEHQSFRWSPSSYLDLQSISNSFTIYGPIMQLSRPFQLASNGLVPIYFDNSSSLSFNFPLSWRATSYHHAFGSRSTADAFEFMHETVQRWTSSFMVSIERHASNPSEPAYVFREWVSRSCSCDFNEYRDTTPYWGTLPEFDHEDLVYHMVTEVLGLDYGICREKGLVLSIVPRRKRPSRVALSDGLDIDVGPYIGLSRCDYGAESAWWQAGQGLDGSVKTIAVRGKNGLNLPLLETIRVGKDQIDGLPTYKVVGIWIPTKDPPYLAIGGSIPISSGEEVQGYLA